VRQLLRGHGNTAGDGLPSGSKKFIRPGTPPGRARHRGGATAVREPRRTTGRRGRAGENRHIRTPHLARGYLDDPPLTAERFTANPFTRDPADRQIKLRGFRIEPGEIESALARHPGVQSAAVLLDGEKLAAWFVARPGPTPTAAELRDFVATLLPQYMVPGSFAAIGALPLTPNAKLDTHALRQQLDGTAAASGAVVRPWTPLQVQILRLWEELLPGRAIGMRDNFFELGGHSLLAVRLPDRIEQEYGRKLPLAVFFAAATVEQLADHLAREEMGDARPLLEIQTGRSRPPFLFWHGDLGGGGFYTQKISRHLGPDQPFHVLPPCRLEGDVVPDLEPMAAEHLRVIRAHTPPD